MNKIHVGKNEKKEIKLYQKNHADISIHNKINPENRQSISI